jgi:hypothetical protein
MGWHRVNRRAGDRDKPIGSVSGVAEVRDKPACRLSSRSNFGGPEFRKHRLRALSRECDAVVEGLGRSAERTNSRGAFLLRRPRLKRASLVATHPGNHRALRPLPHRCHPVRRRCRPCHPRHPPTTGLLRCITVRHPIVMGPDTTTITVREGYYRPWWA